MSDVLNSIFLYIDMGIAVAIISTLAFGLYRKWWKTSLIHFFIIGFLLGLSWEILFLFHSPYYSSQPWYEQALRFPFHPLVQTLTHSIWDGGLFIVGHGLVVKLSDPPHFKYWNAKQLGLLVLWGQLQELAVEIVAIVFGSWNFLVHPWNPALFYIQGQPITLLPQLIWLIASVVYYIALLFYHRTVLNPERASR